jgi:hypothetical protein
VAINGRAATGNELILSVSLPPSRFISRLIETDPYQPIDALRSCLTIGPDPLRSASTKLPLAAYGGLPSFTADGFRVS